MKRGIITLTLLILLTTPLILAENITEDLSALEGEQNIKTENILERQITLPEILEVPLEIILGIKEDSTWQQLIIVLGVFIGFFILIFSITDFLPFFKGDMIKFLGALIITALISITGVLEMFAIFIYDIAGFFKWTASWGPLQLIIAIAIAALTIYFFNKVSNMLKHKMKIGKVEETNRDINLLKKIAKIQKDIIEKPK